MQENNEGVFDINFKDPFREVSPVEYSNLNKKASKGFIPVDYLRSNLFNVSTRKSKDYIKNKVLIDDGVNSVEVNRLLHQRHRDVLSILYTDNFGISKPNPDGSYYIFTNLYHIAKEMGYSKPQGAIGNIKQFLNDMRATSLIYKTKKKKKKIEETNEGKKIVSNFNELGHTLLGEYSLDEDTGHYKILIPEKTAKFQILSYAFSIPKEVNKKILQIPIKFTKTKAVIGYLLSNQSLKNGIKFDTVFEKLGIFDEKEYSELEFAKLTANEIEKIKKKRRSLKSSFKVEIKNNQSILNEFGIFYLVDEEKFVWQNDCKIQFERGIDEKEAMQSYAKAFADKHKNSKPSDTGSLFDELENFETKIELEYTNKSLLLNNDKVYKLIKAFKDKADKNIIKLQVLDIEDESEVVISTKRKDFQEVYSLIFNYNLKWKNKEEEKKAQKEIDVDF